MHASLLASGLTLISIACAAGGLTANHAGSKNSPTGVRQSCPEGSERARRMVENFLTNPNLSEERNETGTDNLDPEEIQVLQDKNDCQKVKPEFENYREDYVVSYYKVGEFYFVTQVLKQPDNPDKVASGLSMIYIMDENLNFIKGYSG